ncbi:MAG TPA: MBL fold metallo-hydrolase, partial [Polyangiaceae bacterium LLY-WYZ-15_(1-7)]|nr:MBL fold metallo-hydrolase [Polyangiaceae bacterium LLY-WYZ-15_(1-7)]
MRTVVVGSGSEGNATIFESGGTRVLVDAGLSVRRVRRRYEEATGEALGRVDAIVLTHHHGD